MAHSRAPMQVNPGKGLGFLLLGGSLHDVLIRLKAQPNLYPTINVCFSSKDPLEAPITLMLPENGLRLRFDGPDQRLRLIEVLDFLKMPLTYKGTDLVKAQDVIEGQDLPSTKATGPAFRQVYHKLFGPTFAGEYFPPGDGSNGYDGIYVLSYPGVAFSFSLQHTAWSPKSDFVSILSSSSASPATCLSIFNGASWKEARQDYLVRPCPHPRSLALVGRGREASADEIETIKIKGRGRIEIIRRSSPSFNLVLSETTAQDLVAQLGPPDAIYRKYDRKMSIHKNRTASRSDHPPFTSGSPGQLDPYSDTDRSSVNTTTDYSSMEDEAESGRTKGPSLECFYNYFHHGFDIFISYPAAPSPALDPAEGDGPPLSMLANSGQLVATKLILHGNIPGSYAFNRYRRSRWRLDFATLPYLTYSLSSESRFSELSKVLQRVWENTYADEEEKNAQQRPMVLNRDWGDSPASSYEFADFKTSEDAIEFDESEPSLGTTQLYGFPGLLFEVLKNDAISCLTIY